MTTDSEEPNRLLALLDGYRVVQALHAAAELGVADLLRDGPRQSEDVARELGVHAPSLRRLLRALASIDVLEDTGGDRFALAPLGELLRSDVPGSMRAAIRYYGGRRHWTAWGQLLDSVKSGSTAFAGRSSAAFLEMARRDPQGAILFNEAMAALTAPVNAEITRVCDFAGIGTLVDVGGGYGALLVAILRAHPTLRGVLFDIPPVIEIARARIEAEGLAPRCEAIGGDAFQSVPAGADAYVLKWVLHDWSDDLAVQLLRNCRASIRDDGRLLIVERVMPEQAAAESGGANRFLSDLNMLLLSGGRERTEAEYSALLANASFALQRIVPTSTPHCVLEALPA